MTSAYPAPIGVNHQQVAKEVELQPETPKPALSEPFEQPVNLEVKTAKAEVKLPEPFKMRTKTSPTTPNVRAKMNGKTNGKTNVAKAAKAISRH